MERRIPDNQICPLHHCAYSLVVEGAWYCPRCAVEGEEKDRNAAVEAERMD